ncbi:hypothetical protein AAFF_G00252710 [Aldrovandia affinis]|uniref:G-protein coupled receptors family 1 profile domain-containing protein n=1 Tax=Aldrovandia affinis TaxID=143900 RepID=A0AAD7SVL5_9TELE|nr:hypothetical protein AAFF_G00252710 [Aldrovandia affinis]
MDVAEWIESFIRGFMCLLGILGNNWLAIRSLPGRKSHIRTNEALFINLATSNLITNYLVDLPDAMADFADHWFLGRLYCGVFRFCSDLSETSSIFSTLLISVFWHQKLVGTLRRGAAPVQLDNLRLVTGLLAGGWAVAMVFSIPHFFFVSLETDNGSSDDCVATFPSATARQTYEAMYLTLANAVPIAGMVFACIRIVITLLRHRARILGPDAALRDAPASESNLRYGVEGTRTPGAGAADALERSSVHVHVHALPRSSDFALSLVEPSKVPGSSGPKVHRPHHVGGGVQRGPQVAPPPRPVKGPPSPGAQVRAAKSVVAVASVFLVCWLTHLLLRITSNVNKSSLVVEVASYIAASYTCIIPYIFLYGIKKLSCSCRR